MEIKIDLSYKTKKASAFLIGSDLGNAVLVKMVTSVCTVLQEQLLAEVGPDESGSVNWNITWTKK